MESERMSDAAYAEMLRYIKVPVYDLLTVTSDRRVLLVLPCEGPAAGRWSFPGQIAIRSDKTMRQLAHAYAITLFGIDLDILDVLEAGHKERRWKSSSSQYLVHWMEARVPVGMIDPSRLELPDKYEDAMWASSKDLENLDAHRFVKDRFSVWNTDMGIRALNW